MTLVSIILVLALEQWRPLAERQALAGALHRYAAFLAKHFNAGERQHGVIAWLLAVLPLLAGAWIVYAVFAQVHFLLGLAFNVAVLYLTMGFRQASHYFTDIHKALVEGDLDRARSLLGQWRGRSADALSREEVVRVSIEQALVGSHHYVFAVAFWFAVLPGPTGAILYRVASALADRWGDRRDPELAQFGWFARIAFRAIDWLPARLTAISFAIVGDFEDAAYCWRTQAADWDRRDQRPLAVPDAPVDAGDGSPGVVLATGAGALGVRLGNPLRREDGSFEERPELGLGDEPDVPSLDSTVGLIWRALVLWLAMILIVTIVRVLG